MTEGGGPRQVPDPEPPDPEPSEAGPSAAMAEESTLTPAPVDDDGSLIPTQLPDAPEFVPSAMGMASGVVISPPSPDHVSSSAWVTSAPQAGGTAIGRPLWIGVTLLGLVVLGVVAFLLAGSFGLLPNDRGRVLFGSARGEDLCHVANPTTTLKVSEPLFFAAVLRDTLDGSATVTLLVTKDGQEQLDFDDSQVGGKPFGCYGNVESLSDFNPGRYHFEVRFNGAVQAAGDLTITE